MPLPNLPTEWVDLCVEGILLPGHVAHLFIHSPVSSLPLTFDPVASFVSALNLHCKCPPTLLKALANTHPDHEVWLQSYKEEKEVFSPSMHTVNSLWENIVPFAKKARHKLSLLCAS
jgi:hypothetical protein